MGLKVTGKGGNSIEPVPAGVHLARCYSVVDLGTHYSERWEKSKQEVSITFEIPGELIMLEVDGKQEEHPRVVGDRFTASLGDKANLRKFIESWRGKKFTPEELEGFDLGAVIGAPCQLSVVHATKGDKTYANIDAIMPLPKGMTVPDQFNKSISYAIDEDGAIFPENMPEWQQKIVQESQEWERKGAAAGVADDPGPNDTPAEEAGVDENLPF
jgi:hypothetical protein